jgi:arylsulfatase
MRFTHNCVTTAICWISRATLYMGQYMSRHRSTKIRNPTFYRFWNNSFVRILQQQGSYYVGHIGKWHFSNFHEVEKYWDYSSAYYGHHWIQHPDTKQKIHVTQKNEEDALYFLKNRPKDQPFFLSVCFFAPHAVDHEPEQYFPQPSSMAWYNDTSIPKTISATEDAWKKMPSFFSNSNEGRVRWRWRFETEEKRQKMMKNYYRLITEIDAASSRIFEELKNQNIVEETLIVFTTDNGLFQGEHGIAGKWYPHEESIRVPLIILDPRMNDDLRGTTNSELTLSVDLASTFLAAAKLPPHPLMQGRDIAELYLERVNDWRNEFYYEHPMHLRKSQIPGSSALVRKEWKYIRWTDFNFEELFDLKNDPFELNNTYDIYSNTSILQEMKAQFEKLKETTM